MKRGRGVPGEKGREGKYPPSPENGGSNGVRAFAGGRVQGYAGRRESFPDPRDFLPALEMDLAGTRCLLFFHSNAIMPLASHPRDISLMRLKCSLTEVTAI